MTPVGVAWSASAWNTALPRTGPSGSDTIICSCRTSAYTFINNGVAGVAGTLFGTDRIRQDVDLVTARINYRWGNCLRSSRSTDLTDPISIELRKAGLAPAFLLFGIRRNFVSSPLAVCSCWRRLLPRLTWLPVRANGGWGSSRKCRDITNFVLVGPIVPNLPGGCHDASGGTVGGQIGYRWQAGHMGVRPGSAGQLG